MKYRAQTATRTVPHTVNGRTRMITEEYMVQVPVPPRDWDRIVLGGVCLVAVLAVAASVVWSTASIGDLLSRAVVPAIAYLAAAVFDLAWITCMAAEWLARYDTRKAALPRRAGHVALGLAMAAVAVHGWLTGSIWVGLVGALVSALAKGMWMIAIHHNAKPLDHRTQMWVEQETAEAGAQLAMVAVRRQVARALEAIPDGEATVITTAEGSAAQESAAVRAAKATMPDATPEEIVETLARIGFTVSTDQVSEAPVMRGDAPPMRADARTDAPQVSTLPSGPAPATKTAAILAASTALPPDASAADIALHLAQNGIAADTAYIRTVLSRAAKQQAQSGLPGTEGYL